MRSVSDLPPVLVQNILESSGEQGLRWMEDLPALIDVISREWNLRVGAAYPMSFHWIARVTTADGVPAVLKLGVPDGHLASEVEALRIFDGDGAVRLLAEDLERGALLIERAVPGDRVASLVPIDDVEATDLLITAGRKLHRVPPEGCALPHLRDEGDDFRSYLARFKKDGPLPRRLVEKAADLFEALCDSADDRVLHGDLHHDNVLRAGDGWKAIDPFGRVGDPGFDCGPMLYNPDPPRRDPDLLKLVPARIEQLADGYGMPVERVRAWGFVMGVLSEVWNADGGTVGTRALDVALMIDRS
jgi:streptomycin 6-kinase